MRPVERFEYCPQCGKAGVAKHGEKAIECSHCGLLLFMNVAAAVGAIIEDEQGRILMLRRAKDPRKGKLGIPGGFVDPGETMESALNREVLEEVNLEIDSIRYVCSHANDYMYRGASYPTTDVFFACTVKSLKPLKAMDEVEGIEFLRPEQIDLDEVAFPSMRVALRIYMQSR